MNQIFEFLDSVSLYLVFVIIFVIWLGIAIYVFRIGRGLKKLEEEE